MITGEIGISLTIIPQGAQYQIGTPITKYFNGYTYLSVPSSKSLSPHLCKRWKSKEIAKRQLLQLKFLWSQKHSVALSSKTTKKSQFTQAVILHTEKSFWCFISLWCRTRVFFVISFRKQKKIFSTKLNNCFKTPVLTSFLFNHVGNIAKIIYNENQRDMFIFNMRNRDAQKELCRETKTHEEALKIAMSYERGNKYVKTYKRSVSGFTGSAYTAPGGSLQIEAEPISNIRRPMGQGIQRGRGTYQNRGGARAPDRRCYNCDQPNFTPGHRQRCPARSVTCNFCKKVGHFEKTCRGKRLSRGGQAIGLIQGDELLEGEGTPSDEASSQHAANSVRFVEREDRRNPVGFEKRE